MVHKYLLARAKISALICLYMGDYTCNKFGEKKGSGALASVLLLYVLVCQFNNDISHYFGI